MRNTFSAKSLLHSLYSSTLLRILLVLTVLLCAAYYALILPWLNRAISTNYLQQTGHQLSHDKLQVQLFKCKVDINQLKDSARLWQAEKIYVDLGCWQSLRQRSLIINEIIITKLVANPHQANDGRWNFADILQHISKREQSSPNSQQDTTPVLIKSLTLRDAKVNANLLALDNMAITLAPLNISISNIDLHTSSASNFSLKGNINQATPVEISGKLNVMSLSGELDIHAQKIPFIWFDSLIKPYAALQILDGAIEVRNHISLRDGVPQTLVSSGKLTDLKVRPTTMEQDAVKWKSLEWEQASVAVADKFIHIPLMTLNALDGQFIITKDRTTNVQAMFKPAVTEPTATVAVETDPHAAPWRFSLDRLTVNNAAVGFFDQSLIPSFNVIVQQFSGAITDIASDPEKTAAIHLAGNVDGYAPVNLDGKAKFFITQPQLDVRFNFTHMDMGALSPYSAEYAGWKIKKGLLSVNLDYHYEEGKILGKNHVVIDHLEFGEKVRGSQMIDLPLRLALALLTDEKGVAVIDAEITGQPSDPNFNIRETLWRAFRNTLKKVATAPFNFLANLVKTKEDLGRIEFTPGESQLSAAAIEKITLLQEAMTKRPKMRLSIEGRYDTTADLLALQDEQVNSAMQKEGLSLDAIKARDSLWAKAVEAKYKAKGLSDAGASAEEKFKQLAALEVVEHERFNRLAHERAQAVKQYFVLKLNAPGERFLLDSVTQCSSDLCNSSEVVFTLDN